MPRMIKRSAIAIGSALMPQLFMRLKAARARAHSENLEKEWGCSELTVEFVRRHGDSVLHGPFKGLRFPSSVHHRHLVPKLIGSYERQLHDVISRVLERQYEMVLDIGAAEGYYAMGFALRMPRAKVFSFDTDRWSRRVVRQGAKLNGLSNLSIQPACTPGWLRNNLVGNSLIVSDCEGYEEVLFLGAASSRFDRTDLIIETHEKPAPGITQRLIEQFASSHDVTVLNVATDRAAVDVSSLDFATTDQVALATREHRAPSQQWLFLESRERRGIEPPMSVEPT